MNEYWLYGIIILLVVLSFYLFRLVFNQYRLNQRQKKRMKLGKKLEAKAQKVLSRKGFKNIRYQKQYNYKLIEDGSQKVIKIIPDFTATRHGKFCVIEVKTGQSAPSVYNESTRRQLLEYNFVLKPDRLYLLDMGRQQLKEIRF
ncbi:hypothetical protein ACE1ET_02175 [Saccharicrinis sp. FJH62]|uniref:hypothetical protein n=1 Tax=Saccharicrinis sp. FJH62 TaxID=3344657 RepID=UPI0035D3F8EB